MFASEVLMLVEVRDMRDDSFQIIFPKFSRWIEISGNEMYSLPCLALDEFKKLMGNKIRPLPDDDFKTYLQNLTDEQLAEVRFAMARNIAPGNEVIYPESEPTSEKAKPEKVEKPS
jgi:hypothetical protein